MTDRALTQNPNWASYSHQELYDAVHADNDPVRAGAIAGAWTGLSGEITEHAQRVSDAIKATVSSWQGPAGEAARNALGVLRQWSDQAAETAGALGQQVADQSQIMADARAAMPAPVVFDWKAELEQGFASGGLLGFAVAARDVRAKNEQANAAHEQAIAVMSAMETQSRQLDGTTPQFSLPPNPIGTAQARTQSLLRGRVKEHDQAAQERRLASPAEPGMPADTGGAVPQPAAFGPGAPGEPGVPAFDQGGPGVPGAPGAPAGGPGVPGGMPNLDAYAPAAAGPGVGGVPGGPGGGVPGFPGGPGVGGEMPDLQPFKPSTGELPLGPLSVPGPSDHTTAQGFPSLPPLPDGTHPGGAPPDIFRTPPSAPGPSSPPFGPGPFTGPGPGSGNPFVPPPFTNPGGGPNPGQAGGPRTGPGAAGLRGGAGGFGASGESLARGAATGSAAPGGGTQEGSPGNRAGAAGAAGRAGTPGMAGPGAGAHGKREEDKERKSSPYVQGEDIFRAPGDDLPPPVIGAGRKKKTDKSS
ncbi:PPE domain-containing protein [Amycolatopsis taiwanensis]|uniref:PPE domain-containing protein n=1 Tax=Amycolatopsis taiwanensis TaxID=342230 RepID=UPI0004887C8A|nr:PPE domain-containing protein [Amycolatopsis taiwanensis]